MTHERSLDLHRYWRMKEKGRISPRTAAATASFFSPEKSTIQEKDLKYFSPEEDVKENISDDEPPLSKYINCGTFLTPHKPPQRSATITQRYSLQSQSKEERLRKLGKWERFRRSRQVSEDIAKRLVGSMPYPSAPSVTHEREKESFQATVPTHFISSGKEANRTKNLSKKAPIDPPLVITTAIRTESSDPPTKKVNWSASERIRGEKSAELIKSKALNTYSALKAGLQAEENDDTARKRYNQKILKEAIEGTSNNPICLEDFESPFPPRLKDSPEGTTKAQYHRKPSFGYTPPRPTSTKSNDGISEEATDNSTTPKNQTKQQQTLLARFGLGLTPPGSLRQLRSTTSSSTASSQRQRRDRIAESRDEIAARENTVESRDNHHFRLESDSRQSPPAKEVFGQTNPRNIEQRAISPIHGSNEQGLDPHTVRILFSKDFSRMVQYEKDNRIVKTGSLVSQPCGGNGVSFIIRKRPILEQEMYRGDFDVISAETGNSGGVIVYETKVLSDFKSKDLTAHTFQCDRALSEHQTIEDLYIGVGQPHVKFAKQGGFASFVIYGSAGSGKTQTMTDLKEWAACDIFEPEKVARENDRTVSLQYVEINGKNCFDLLSPGSFIQVVDNRQGFFQLKGAAVKTASSTAELMKLFSQAKRRFAARTKVRKKGESSSFVFCQMTISEAGRRRNGCLTLLECPARNQNNDLTVSGDKESVQSFDALMKCISAKISPRSATNPNYRINSLAKLMKESIESRDSRVCVVLTLSPNATDTENSIETLSLIENVRKGYQQSNGTSLRRPSTFDTATQYDDLVLPRQWDNKELANWMERKNLMGVSIPANINGRFAMRMTKMQLKNAFYNSGDDEKASRLYANLRSENDRVARLRVKRRMSQQIKSSTY